MDCDHDQLNAGLCETIVELGKRFGLKTVAEGIETTHESHKLQGIGCHVGQGYLFAKPMPKGELIGMMRKRLMKSAPVPQPVRGLGFA
jgi:EAL domain-containing protein (putative c-di-GMP-specific phosphodiesterase class I)